MIAGVIDVTFTSLSGQTPGKYLFGIRVETLDGGPVKFRHAVRRWTVPGLALALPPAAAVAVLAANALPSFLGRERRSIADWLAGTRVVSDREAGAWQRTESETFVVHMGMEKWIAAVTGDVTVLPSRGLADRQTIEDVRTSSDDSEPNEEEPALRTPDSGGALENGGPESVVEAPRSMPGSANHDRGSLK
ncbi:MAG TPA: RDD family protein [Acidimicrobiales bacterium]|nr:RDD family protein [Acidimicrobiales bacterium]